MKMTPEQEAKLNEHIDLIFNVLTAAELTKARQDMKNYVNALMALATRDAVNALADAMLDGQKTVKRVNNGR
jgi:hypothetical protein